MLSLRRQRRLGPSRVVAEARVGTLAAAHESSPLPTGTRAAPPMQDYPISRPARQTPPPTCSTLHETLWVRANPLQHNIIREEGGKQLRMPDRHRPRSLRISDYCRRPVCCGGRYLLSNNLWRPRLCSQGSLSYSSDCQAFALALSCRGGRNKAGSLMSLWSLRARRIRGAAGSPAAIT
ncbi:hypothetical protein I546_0288 [Mycobacterium kansasii 732]|nr:hypothetical protein I546_0288 [Mycobacterium kansasii 732]